MPTPKLSITIRNASQAITKLERYRNNSSSLEAKYQQFIAEMIMLRLFSVLEDSVSEIAYKLASGAKYLNGCGPNLSIQAGSMSGSRGLFLSHGRTRPIQNLKWTKARFIRESVQHVISPTDPFIASAQRNGATIDEMRKIRNVLAHNTKSAKSDYKTVVRLAYGANVKITPGAFLSTTRRNPVCKLNQYLASTKIILTDMVGGV
tara:strand:+ start:1104 stop:1718 length:615 start_codon:yes stop_codon:yes gene_type:complete